MSWSVRVSLVVLILCAFGDVQGQGALSQTFLRRYNLDAMQGGLAITTAKNWKKTAQKYIAPNFQISQECNQICKDTFRFVAEIG